MGYTAMIISLAVRGCYALIPKAIYHSPLSTSLVQVDGGNEIAAIYDVAANSFVPFHIAEHPFCAGQFLPHSKVCTCSQADDD